MSTTTTTPTTITPEAAQTLFEKFKTFLAGAGHVVADVVEFPVKVEKVVATVITQESALKPVLTQLLTQGAAIAGDVITDADAKGLNFVSDEATVTAIGQFFSYFKATVIPAIEAAYAATAPAVVALGTTTTTTTSAGAGATQ